MENEFVIWTMGLEFNFILNSNPTEKEIEEVITTNTHDGYFAEVRISQE